MWDGMAAIRLSGGSGSRRAIARQEKGGEEIVRTARVDRAARWQKALKNSIETDETALQPPIPGWRHK
ncbi:hypothetical protein [Paraburkholderia flava]|uniref:hypothetical protein n=1 Tax=Paraburkholderia flava TaxID=2547393 RepID=UPI00105C8E07|nr:hypothetical protein [Paraburkholderia flava]